MKKILSIVSAAFIVFGGTIGVGVGLAAASAQTVPAQTVVDAATAPAAALAAPNTDNCALTPADFASLTAIQKNPDLTPTQELNQELTLRRQLLAQTITCATQDAQALQATLAAVSSTAANAPSIQSQLSGKINNAINFYTIESAKVGTAGVSATEAIAKEMLAWRATNYTPLEGDVNNFALWSANQALFATAQTRLTQTVQVVSFIENAAAGNGDLDTALSTAQSSLATAQSENAAAGTAIGQAQLPDQTLGFIQQSLQSLANTYQKFSDLNGLIQKLLPTSGN